MHSNHARPVHMLAAVLAILLAAFVWQAGANAVRPPALPTAVATVDIVEIFEKLDELRVREDELEANKNARQAQLQEVADQINILKADLEAGTPGTDEYEDKIRQMMEIQAVYEARGNALGRILSIDRGNVTRETYEKITDAIARIADREGYDIVLFDDSLFVVPEGAQYQDVFRSIVSRSVIYRHEGVDITDQVVTMMNNEFNTP